ncbi:MAG: integrase, partial [Burkholderiales bacterium]
MSVGCRVKKIRISSGERFPLLVHSFTGMPLWSPTIFVMTELRASNCASLTLLQATRAIMVGYRVLAHLAIDIEERINQGRMFELHELDALVNLAGLEQKAL